MIENKIIFDDDMSWTDDMSQVIQVKKEMKNVHNFEDSGLHDQFFNHGLFTSEYVHGLDVDDNDHYSLMPHLVVPKERMKTDDFREFFRDLELYCEKVRHAEQIDVHLWTRMNGDVFEIFSSSDSDFVLVEMSSPRVGHWSCRVVFSVKYQYQKERIPREDYSSMSEILESLLDSEIFA